MPTITAPATVRADWSSVTLAEYAALHVLAGPDPLAELNATWDEIHEANPLRGDAPTRLTPEGETWLAGLVATVRKTHDEHDRITAARDFLRCIGVLTVTAAARKARQS